MLVTETELEEHIKAIREKHPDVQIYVGGDQAVEYGKIITVMAALKNNGVPKVGLMTSQPPEK